MKHFFLFLVSLFLFHACTTALDFDQAQKLTIQPVIEADMLYFDLNKNNLTDNQNNFRHTIKDTVDFNIFNDGKTRDSFVKADITLTYKNTFERQFETTVYFIDNLNQVVDQAYFIINKTNPTQEEINGTETFTFDTAGHPDFVTFRKIVVAVQISPDNLPVEDGKLHVQAKGRFYTNITIE